MNRHLMTAVLMLGTLALAGCLAGTPAAPTPTPVVVVSTTAKQLDTSAFSIVTAGPLLDIPSCKYVMLQGSTRASYCSTNCSCPVPHDWSALSPSKQEQMMRGMIGEGARGFVDWRESSSYSPCACTIASQERRPIQDLPFRGLGEFTIYRVDPDGTVTARVSGATYTFKPGDAWSSTFRNSPAPPDCVGYLEQRTMSFRNDGLLDQSQFPELSAPTPTPTPFSSH